jgi:glycosyltransferase involved in cell wall biosynthesis
VSVAVLIPADIRFPLERANGIQIVKTAAALARGGVRTTLLVRRSDHRPTPQILALYGVGELPGLTVRRVPVLHRTGAYRLPRAWFLARAGLASALALGRGALVCTRDLQLADWLVRLPLRGRVIYEAHAVEALMYQERHALYGTPARPDPAKAARLAARERRLWRRAGGFVTTTSGIRDTFAEAHGPRDHVRVIPNGCDVAEPREFRSPPEGEPRVLYAGQLYPWKGVDVLVQAMTGVPTARLVILGGLEGEPDLARIRALVAARGLGSRVETPGTLPQAQVAEELARASVVVAPFLRSAMTERHTSPIKAFEAMAAGRPLVASDLPSSREFLRDGENSLLVPPGDASALATALRRLLNDRALAERLARTAWEEAPLYAWDARARRLRELFEEVL